MPKALDFTPSTKEKKEKEEEGERGRGKRRRTTRRKIENLLELF
jgi:hypothetical protein